MKARRLVMMVLLVGCFAPACGSDAVHEEAKACSDGQLGCRCYGNGTCNAGMVCVGTVCEADPSNPPPEGGAGQAPGEPNSPPGTEPPVAPEAGDETEEPPPEPACEMFPANLEENTTIPKGCYLSSGFPSMPKEAVLTLSPGVKLIFTEGAGMIIENGQSLRAMGTAKDPVILTGELGIPGAWQGLTVRNNDSSAHLEHTIIEYGDEAGLTLEAPGTFLLRDVTIRNNAGYGFDLHIYYSQGVVRNCIVTGNGGKPGYIAGSLEALQSFFDDSSTFQGNGLDCIETWAAYDPSWPVLDVPYCNQP